MDGILPVFKEKGITSFDVIRQFKRNIHPNFKVGHGGTLDPFAEGVLLLLLGKATKKMNELMSLPKTYRAVARLGAKSDTLDCTGTIENIPINQPTNATLEKIQAIAKHFVGEIEQVIPDYSATKVNGVPRYKLARKGQAMEQKTKLVKIYDLNIIKFENNRVELVTTVSSGTYIRQLSYDIFKSLGIESYLEELVRTRIGDFSEEKCCRIDDFESNKWSQRVIMF